MPARGGAFCCECAPVLYAVKLVPVCKGLLLKLLRSSTQDAAISSMSIVCASVGNRDVGALLSTCSVGFTSSLAAEVIIPVQHCLQCTLQCLLKHQCMHDVFVADPFIPALISCIARPAEVPDCVHKLSATTFVQVCSCYCATIAEQLSQLACL